MPMRYTQSEPWKEAILAAFYGRPSEPPGRTRGGVCLREARLGNFHRAPPLAGGLAHVRSGDWHDGRTIVAPTIVNRG
jgi:hypothetical protein